MPTWPVSLPQLLESGANEALPDDVSTRSSTSKIGPVRARSQSRSRFKTITGDLPPINLAGKWVFEAFYIQDLAGGALSFDAMLDGTGIVKNYKLIAPPEFKPLGDHYLLSLQLGINP